MFEDQTILILEKKILELKRIPSPDIKNTNQTILNLSKKVLEFKRFPILESKKTSSLF